MTSKEEAKAVLDRVVNILNEGTSISEQVWWILGGLRGPDSDNEVLKRKTTARVRGTLGIKSGNFSQYAAVGALISNAPIVPVSEEEWKQDEDALEQRRRSKIPGAERSTHFLHHFNLATMALEYFGFKPKL
jgi:hypothetical protein